MHREQKFQFAERFPSPSSSGTLLPTKYCDSSLFLRFSLSSPFALRFVTQSRYKVKDVELLSPSRHGQLSALIIKRATALRFFFRFNRDDSSIRFKSVLEGSSF